MTDDLVKLELELGLAYQNGWLDGQRKAKYRIKELEAAHAENARILGYLVNELAGIAPAGKLAALEQCRERSAAIAELTGGKDGNV